MPMTGGSTFHPRSTLLQIHKKNSTVEGNNAIVVRPSTDPELANIDAGASLPRNFREKEYIEREVDD